MRRNLKADDKHICTMNADGVALTAIQGPYQMVKEKDALIAHQDTRIRQMEETLGEIIAGFDC